MNNKTGKVIWFTFKQVVTSNWFCLISVLGLVCVFLSTQIDKFMEQQQIFQDREASHYRSMMQHFFCRFQLWQYCF